ncbi:magnetosome protein MamI [Magnetofaba australis]|uniref:MamI n=1 Tax=Magnetofaba australis IT-1 TaxID=1434232 RepID=W0LJC2_9PROT|nr:magnetosome protein MamI [Magnetofaba australis]AHG23891.1 MamI [Magnetofaba australis IT-1]OSM08638.1 putative Magnetosome protein MamI [Magnetofaba australis IT-1]
MPSIIFGLIAISLGLWGLSVWWWSVVELLRGLTPLFLIGLGFVALGAGVTRLRAHEAAPESMDADIGLREDASSKAGDVE